MDEKAFEELVLKESPKVYSICYQYMADQGLAEDMVQETFIKVYASIDDFDGQSNISTWIYRIAVNTCLSEIRKRQTLKRKTTVKVLAQSEEEVQKWNDSIQTAERTDDKISRREDTEALYAAIYQLSDDQKSAFILYHLDERPIKEVAQIMNKSESAVEGLVHRARTKMRELLYDYYHNTFIP